MPYLYIFFYSLISINIPGVWVKINHAKYLKYRFSNTSVSNNSSFITLFISIFRIFKNYIIKIIFKEYFKGNFKFYYYYYIYYFHQREL